MSEKENINPKINKTSGYMSEESYSYSKRDESPFKRSKQEQISSSSSSSKNSTPTPENQPAQEPNSERLQNFYNKMLKFSSLKNISEDDLYDKVEECFMYCKKLIKNADKNIYYNEADYKLVSEIMNLVAITTIRAKF